MSSSSNAAARQAAYTQLTHALDVMRDRALGAPHLTTPFELATFEEFMSINLDIARDAVATLTHRVYANTDTRPT